VGGVNPMLADVFPGVADSEVGGDGNEYATIDEETSELELPARFVATTVNV